MKTEELIQELAAAPRPRCSMPKASAISAATACGLMIAVVIALACLGVRHDWPHALTPMALKIGYGLTGATLLTPLVLRAVSPSVQLRGAAIGSYLLPALAVLAAGFGFVIAPDQFQWMLLQKGAATGCVACIAALAVPIGAILMLAARRFGPTRLTLAGVALGALAGALAIIPYSLICRIDSIAYVATWYSLAILLCALAGAVLGGRVLRW